MEKYYLKFSDFSGKWFIHDLIRNNVVSHGMANKDTAQKVLDSLNKSEHEKPIK